MVAKLQGDKSAPQSSREPNPWNSGPLKRASKSALKSAPLERFPGSAPAEPQKRSYLQVEGFVLLPKGHFRRALTRGSNPEFDSAVYCEMHFPDLIHNDSSGASVSVTGHKHNSFRKHKARYTW